MGTGNKKGKRSRLIRRQEPETVDHTHSRVSHRLLRCANCAFTHSSCTVYCTPGDDDKPTLSQLRLHYLLAIVARSLIYST